jgi:hypothetical protein
LPPVTEEFQFEYLLHHEFFWNVSAAAGGSVVSALFLVVSACTLAHVYNVTISMYEQLFY